MEKSLSISKDEKELYKLAKTIKDVIRDGREGQFIEFSDIPTKQLELLVKEAQGVIDWRALPGGNPGGH